MFALIVRTSFIAGALVACLGGTCLAAPSPNYVGRWAVQVDDRNILILDLEPPDHGKNEGVLYRLKHSSWWLTRGSISKLSGPLIQKSLTYAVSKDGEIDIATGNPSTPNNMEKLMLTILDNDHAEVKFLGTLIPQVSAIRVAADALVSQDWDASRTYQIADLWPINAEMTAIFDADQGDRKILPIDWSVVSKADAARRDAVHTLLQNGNLHTGDDFLHAAFVFQHGDKPDDYLLAHTLAMVAVKKGQPDALWIAAATLDRYLQRSEKPQIFGTQFSKPNGQLQFTQEPYNRDLVSDGLRGELGIPPLDVQKIELSKYNKPEAKADGR